MRNWPSICICMNQSLGNSEFQSTLQIRPEPRPYSYVWLCRVLLMQTTQTRLGTTVIPPRTMDPRCIPGFDWPYWTRSFGDWGMARQMSVRKAGRAYIRPVETQAYLLE